ncbi:MAG: methyltransferase domain-containing protein [Alphaproteobacteria bacterium]|nr:methyltransferase domain-containing protein [Alphaproteobacteria bacterium]
MPSAYELKQYYDRREWFEGGEPGGYQNYDKQTEWSLDLVTSLLAEFPGGAERSVLDIGCGYGTHLALAAERGWKCFGVEPSNHARGIAKQRLGGRAFVVEDTAELIPHEFDLVLILDTIEHLPSPYALLYSLFSIGAITAKTRVVISTPNAGSADAKRDPATWAYRHPPSHLVYYSERALTYLLQHLHFTTIDIRGTGPDNAGLLASASGSDFTDFMRERYVPGTWSKIAEYEHVPRYALAKDVVKGKTVLDFGCGTGYGAAKLATQAASVTGLDIDTAAIRWASATHRNDNLKFVCLADLGASLPAASFDVVTCFEMIEHVDHETQKALIASFARLLKPDGVMLISTPNPETTKLYGANPYHIREMNEAELHDLVSPHFSAVQILRQHVRAGVTFELGDNNAALRSSFISEAHSTSPDTALAFIAVCGQASLAPHQLASVFFDRGVDYISTFMSTQNTLTRTRLDLYLQSEVSANYQGQAQKYESLAKVYEKQTSEFVKQIAAYETQTIAFQQQAQQIAAEIAQTRTERNLALHEREQAKAETQDVRMAYHHLSQRRDIELSSPRFLLRQAYAAIKARIQQQLARPPTKVEFASQEAVTHEALAALMAHPPTLAGTKKPFACSLVIPTKNGGDLFKTVVAGLQRQTIWPNVEFIIVDSGSTDDTIAIAKAAGAECYTIPPSEFNHGSTRDFAIGKASSNKIVLTVQDATPLDVQMIEKLLSAFEDPEVVGAYGRQIPQPDADAITKRNLNTWLTGRTVREVRALPDPAAYDTWPPMERYLASNFDNVCSAIRKSEWEVRPFGRVDFGEDIEWAQSALIRGRRIVYEPTAAVVHSHDRPIAYEYKRTYVCHRKLNQLFGLHMVPTLGRAVQGWLHMMISDMGYTMRAKVPLATKIKLLAKLPALTAMQILGQYQGAKDHLDKSQKKISGV